MSTTDPSPSSPTPPQNNAPSAQRTAEARAAFTASLSSVGTSIDADLQSRARNIHANAAALRKQEDALAASTKALKKENEKLEKLVGRTKRDLAKVNGGGREVEEMLGGVDEELRVLEEMMRIVEEGDWGSEDEDGGEGEGGGVDGDGEGEVGESAERQVPENEVRQVSDSTSIPRS